MTTPASAIVMIGPMGAGKTSVGKRVARTLDVPFFDTDAAISREHGPIEQLFAERGEAHFRALERAAVVEGLATGGVVSLGGGAVLDPDTRALLAGHRVVFLRVGLSEAVKRVGLGAGRPMLFGNVRARIKALLDERGPIYESVATVVVDTDDATPDDVADRIEEALA
jgi:shikimate kinase